MYLQELHVLCIYSPHAVRVFAMWRGVSEILVYLWLAVWLM